VKHLGLKTATSTSPNKSKVHANQLFPSTNIVLQQLVLNTQDILSIMKVCIQSLITHHSVSCMKISKQVLSPLLGRDVSVIRAYKDLPFCHVICYAES
jgi:hypothetical protein